jgi:hypothetical protein
MSKYNVGQIGKRKLYFLDGKTNVFPKTKQVTIYDKENEGVDLVKSTKNNSERDNKMAGKTFTPKPSAPAEGKREIVEVDAWVNLGGKAVFVKIDGKSYITSRMSIEQLLNGEKKGVKLGLIKE